MPIKLAIADDHRLFIEGMRLIIDSFSDMEIVLIAENGQQLLDAIPAKQPDIVLLDIKMPVLDGIETTRILRQNHPDIRVLLLSLHNDKRLIKYLMDLGANGYLLKNETPETVRQAITSVMQSGYYFNDYVSRALLDNRKAKNADSSKISLNGKLAQFTNRELEVLSLICRQHTTNEIAGLLYITTRTVEGHRKSLLEKSGARNLAGLVIYALQNKLVDVPPV
ncbi:MAG: response regulator transcription factor [Bacteroidota bacterium]